MKKIIVSLLLIPAFQAYCQKLDASKVPVPVTGAFSKNFSTIKNVKWEKEDGNYEANFKKDGKKMAALYDGKGTWMETETDIGIKLLPASAKQYIDKNYKGAKIKEAAKLELPNNVINYEAEINGNDVIFDANGNYLKTKKG